MSAVQESIEVEVPVSSAYNQWTQFETFPQFMEGVEEVRQIDDEHLHWRTNVGGRQEEFDAVITQQEPDKVIAWRSTTGPDQEGAVTFERLGEDRTRVVLEMNFEPEGITEKVGDALGAPERAVKGDLERFKNLLEVRGEETGAWRGRIEDGEAKDTPPMPTDGS